MFRFDADKKEWTELKLQRRQAARLRRRQLDGASTTPSATGLLFVRKGYGDKAKYDGQLYALDLKTATVSTLSPSGMEAAAAIPYLCQLRYDAANDLLLVGGTLPPDDDGVRRTPAYDCADNRWVSLKLDRRRSERQIGPQRFAGHDVRRQAEALLGRRYQQQRVRVAARSEDGGCATAKITARRLRWVGHNQWRIQVR